jgi:steroid delta-isomerase-like uncharacterized protein
MRRLIPFVAVLVLAASLTANTATGAAQEASPAASPSALPSPLLTEWLAAFNAGDPDRLLALYTDDALWEEVAIGLEAQGQEQIRAHLERLFTAAPDITYEPMDAFVAGDHAVVEWVVTGTYQADFPGLPPAAGQPFTFRGASVFELADGEIRRYTEYWDAYTFLAQLGALPAPAAAAPSTPTP